MDGRRGTAIGRRSVECVIHTGGGIITTTVRRCALVLAMAALCGAALAQQEPRYDGGLPEDVNPGSLNRLPARAPNSSDAPFGAAAIRLHGSGVNVRWESPLGRPLMELAILTTAREHDQPYEWSLHEMEAIAVGLDPDVIDVVRHGRPLTGLPDEEEVIIQVGREIFGSHHLSSETYRRAVTLLGDSNLVDVVELMGRYAGTAARLTAFNQHMPLGWPQFLPLPFTLSDDIDSDSRSRLPLLRGPAERRQTAPSLYGRTLSPGGTGPGHIRRHGAGLASLEANVARPLLDLAILVTAREYDAQYEWTLAELTAIEDGLSTAVIDVVRHREPVTGLADKEATLITFGRELFGAHNVRAETYANAVQLFGPTDLVDLVGLMGQHAADTALLIAFDQRLPAGQQPLLTMP